MSSQPKVDQIAVIIGVVVPLAVLCIAISSCCILRRCRNNSNSSGGNYEQVNHGLDDEELAFKRLLEKRKTGETEMTGLSSSSDSPGNGQYNSNMFDDDLYDDVAFDSSELDTLNRLENFRSNLVAAAGDNKNSSNNNSSTSDKNNNLNIGESEGNDGMVVNDDIRL